MDSAFSGDADIVDHQIVVIEYDNGAELCFHASLHAPDEFRRFGIIGNEGMAEGNFVRRSLKAHRAISGECVFEKIYDYENDSQHYGAERRMAKNLVQHFEKGAPLSVSVIDCLRACSPES